MDYKGLFSPYIPPYSSAPLREVFLQGTYAFVQEHCMYMSTPTFIFTPDCCMSIRPQERGKLLFQSWVYTIGQSRDCTGLLDLAQKSMAESLSCSVEKKKNGIQRGQRTSLRSMWHHWVILPHSDEAGWLGGLWVLFFPLAISWGWTFSCSEHLEMSVRVHFDGSLTCIPRLAFQSYLASTDEKLSIEETVCLWVPGYSGGGGWGSDNHPFSPNLVCFPRFHRKSSSFTILLRNPYKHTRNKGKSSENCTFLSKGSGGTRAHVWPWFFYSHTPPTPNLPSSMPLLCTLSHETVSFPSTICLFSLDLWLGWWDILKCKYYTLFIYKHTCLPKCLDLLRTISLCVPLRRIAHGYTGFKCSHRLLNTFHVIPQLLWLCRKFFMTQP